MPKICPRRQHASPTAKVGAAGMMAAATPVAIANSERFALRLMAPVVCKTAWASPAGMMLAAAPVGIVGKGRSATELLSVHLPVSQNVRRRVGFVVQMAVMMTVASVRKVRPVDQTILVPSVHRSVMVKSVGMMAVAESVAPVTLVLFAWIIFA
jgi:hypothetical protein